MALKENQLRAAQIMFENKSSEAIARSIKRFGFAAPIVAWRSRRQVYELGPHRLVCGDSRDAEVWAKEAGVNPGSGGLE